MKYFTAEELACKCGCSRPHGINPEFAQWLDELREAHGKPILLTSAFRCERHPIEARKPGGPGPHTTGKAADILVHGADARRLMMIADKLGCMGMGLKQHGGIESRFLHVDLCSNAPNRPRPWVWTYK